MRVTRSLALLAALCLALPAAGARADADADRRDAINTKFQWQEGDVAVAEGAATLHIGQGFRFLDAEQSRHVLVDLWGNPPESAGGVLGMVFPASSGPASREGWGVVVTYDKDGWISDEGAAKIDYDELMADMQRGVAARNEERKKQGFQAVQLKGWAEPPHYDAAAHKLYWAKRLSFEGAPEDTLNYDIRVLGRHGVLVLNAVSSAGQLETIKSDMERLLPLVEFNEGHRYADYVPGKDKVAEYGLAALVAGGAALAVKGGLLKWLIGGLIAFKKVIVVGAVGAAAAVRRFFSGRSSAPQDTPPPSASA
jgi:uncharacterized membrane-anchored protein